MSYKRIEIVIRSKARIKSRQWWNNNLRKVRRLFLKHLPQKKSLVCSNSAFTLLITNNKEIQNLNKNFRKIDKPTDVLSFHINKKEQLKRKYLGDIVISFQKAKEQALKQMIPIEKELLILLIHGYLHLLGYDHKLSNEAKRMFSLQNKILNGLINQPKNSKYQIKS